MQVTFKFTGAELDTERAIFYKRVMEISNIEVAHITYKENDMGKFGLLGMDEIELKVVVRSNKALKALNKVVQSVMKIK